jgi:paraquat-inducible protein B
LSDQTASGPAASDPQPGRTFAKETYGRWPGLVWALPVAAILIVAYLGLQALAHAGVDVVVTFDSAADAKPGDTQVIYKGLSVGRVTKVALSRDHKHVDMTLRLDPSVTPALRAGTVFWLEGAKPSFTDLNSLKAALAGVTIGLAPGAGAPARHFSGLLEPPEVLPGTVGSTYELDSDAIGATRKGANVYYHGLEVGKVTDVVLTGSEQFQTTIFITAPNDRLVRKGTLFFNASAVEISLSGSGLSTQFAPGNAALSGGVEFDTPKQVGTAPHEPSGSHYPLYSDRGHALSGVRGPQILYRVMFQDPVGDLDVGAAVVLRGFPVGTVTDRTLEVDPATGAVSTPVTIAIEPVRLNSTRDVGELSPQLVKSTDAEIEKLVRLGYRARLAQNPPLVGSRLVELVKVPGGPKENLQGTRSAKGDDYPLIPATSSGDVTALAAKADDILSKVQQVPIAEIGADVRQITGHLNALLGSPKVKDSLDHLDSTLAQIDKTVKETRPKIGPLVDNLNRAADQVQGLASSANALVGGDGATQDASIPSTLRQLTDTARALRSLADYLSRHPESLIRGRAHSR